MNFGNEYREHGCLDIFLQNSSNYIYDIDKIRH